MTLDGPGPCLTPVGVFSEKAGATSLAAFASAALARGEAPAMNAAASGAWIRTATTSYPVALTCVRAPTATRKISESEGAVAAAVKEEMRLAAAEVRAAKGAARLGYLTDATECEAVLGKPSPDGRWGVHLFTEDGQMKMETAYVPPERLLKGVGAKALLQMLSRHSVRISTLSWENEYQTFVDDKAPTRFKPVVALLRPEFDACKSSASGDGVECSAVARREAKAAEAALREATQTLAPAERRLLTFLYADVNKYRGFLLEDCMEEPCPNFAVVFRAPAQEEYDEEGDHQEPLKEALVKYRGEKLWTPDELVEFIRYLLELYAAKIGGTEVMEKAASEADVMGATLMQTGHEDEKEVESKERGSQAEAADPDMLMPELLAKDGKSDATLHARAAAVVNKCAEWAKHVRLVREYWNTLNATAQKDRSAIGEGLSKMETFITKCHGQLLVDDPKDIEGYAKSGRWDKFKRRIEMYSDALYFPGMKVEDVVAAEKAHDAIHDAFIRTMRDAEAQVLDRLGNGDAKNLRLKTTPVPVVMAKDMSVERFVTEHALPGKPVVIRGLNMTPKKPWTLDHFARTCGDVKVQLNTKSTKTTNWGGLVDAGTMPLGEFVREYARNETMRRWYLHDWSLNRYCPDVFGQPPYDEFVVPKYFAGDYFQRIPWSGYDHTWPSLFIGAANTSSALHVDSGATNFWMYLMTGRKKWRFWDREQAFNLYLKPPNTQHFRFRAFDVDLERNPLLADAPMYEAGCLCCMRPIPSGNIPVSHPPLYGGHECSFFVAT